MFSLTTYGIFGAVLLALLAGTGAYCYDKGHASAENACKVSEAITLHASLSAWQESRARQDLADSASKASDAERQKVAADQLTSIAERFDKVKVQIVKVSPPAKCELSPAWISWFNGTNP